MNVTIKDLVLRNFKIEDAASICKYADNRKIWLNLRDGFPHPYSFKDAEVFISKVKSKNPETIFAFSKKGSAVGAIGVTSGEDVHKKSAELGYWLAEPYWGKGIMTEAVGVITDIAFKNLDIVRIFAGIYETNEASARVLEKNGFEFEGRLKSSVFKDGKIMDQLLYAKIK